MYNRKRLCNFVCIAVFIIVVVNYGIFSAFVERKNISTSLSDEIGLKKMVNQTEEPIFETIHVGFVCTGYSENLKIYVLLKSLYFFRSKPLHFHVMVDDVSSKTIKTLFETWSVPQVKVTYYNATLYKSKMAWPNEEKFLNSNGYVKLLLSSVVPTNVTEKIIILDTDLTFSADIYELWAMFDKFNAKQAIGLAQNQTRIEKWLNISDPRHYVKWMQYEFLISELDTILRYNTGVVLYNLKKLQEIDWYSTWTGIANSTIRYTKLQKDIINIILISNSPLIYILPCEWNIQLSESIKPSNCFMSNKPKIIHKYFANEIDSADAQDYNSFLSLHTTFFEYSGNLLRYELSEWENPIIPTKQNSSKNSCNKFYEEINLNRRTLMYFRNFNYTPTKHDVTLVTQFSYEKLTITEDISKRWNGPISFTLYASDYELKRCISFIENSNALKNRSDIAYSVVFRDGKYYPINDLRNISMRTVVTPYIFLVDIDLIPPNTLYNKLKSYLSNINNMSNKALVVPAFEAKTVFPNDKKEVLKMLSKNNLRLFHNKYLPAYGPTDYKKWKTAKVPYTVKYELYFEPYLVVQSNVSEYDRRFIGFGFNKASHSLILSAQNYQFLVLPDVFVTHKNHLQSLGLTENKNSRLYRNCKRIRMKVFMEELQSKYNVTYVINKKIN